jgi:hypothetical protein
LYELVTPFACLELPQDVSQATRRECGHIRDLAWDVANKKPHLMVG